MKLTGRDKLRTQADMQAGRMMGRIAGIILFYDERSDCTATGCGYDSFTQSGLRPDCPTCSGLGYTVSHHSYVCFARVSWPNLTDIVMGLVGKIETGDAILYFRDKDYGYVEKVQREGYIRIDGQRYGIKSIGSAGVGEQQEYVVLCSRQTQ